MKARAGLQPCPDCPYRGPQVGTRGDPHSPFVIVGEGPGRQELREGIPFVGPSGEILWRTLPEEVHALPYILNACQCFPLRKEENPTRFTSAIRACRERLLEQIKAHPRRIILALGNGAMWSLTGNFQLKITQERGRLIPSDLATYGILPAIHPAALLHGVGTYRQFREDVLYAVELANGGTPRKPIEPSFKVCETREAVREAVVELRASDLLAADIETSGFNRRTDDILCLGVCGDPHHVYVFPGEALKKFKRELRGLFNNRRPKWIWHNGKFDIAFLRRPDYGYAARVDHDTMLLSYCIDEQPGIHDLEQIAGDLLGAPDYKFMVKKYAPKKSDSYANVPRHILYEYLAIDVSLTRQIFDKYYLRVSRSQAHRLLYHRTLIPGSELLWWVEQNGILVDREQLEKNRRAFTEEMEAARAEIQEIAGCDVNPASPAQMADLLYKKLKIPTKRRNTNKDTLKLLPQRPVVKALLRFRSASKSLSTYVNSIENAIQDDGRVHATFKLHGTRTGRLSSSDPNMQNIPRKPEIRGTFVAPKGKKLLEIDLNQAELRSLAALSGDTFLCEIYNGTNRSLHKEYAVYRFGENYDHEQYMRAKAVNFGIVYGRQAPSLAEEFRITEREAQKDIDDWFRRAPQAHEFILKCRRAAMRGVPITTCFGRRKHFPLVTRNNIRDLMNEAANFPHQSIASDITFHAALRTYKKLRSWGVLIVDLVHDSILLEVPDDMPLICRVCRLVMRELRQVPRDWGITAVPFTSDAKLGDRWGHLKEFDPATALATSKRG